MGLTQVERIDLSIDIIRNSDMSHDDKWMLTRTLMYAAVYEERKQRRDKWQHEPGVYITGWLAFIAFLMVAGSAFNHDTKVGIPIGMFTMLFLMWWNEGPYKV